MEELLDRGLTEDQVIWVLQSKLVRWLFDSREVELYDFAKGFVTDYMVKEATSNGE